MWVDDNVNNRFSTSKHVVFLDNYYTKASKGIPQINNLLQTGTGRNKLITICGHLYSIIFIITPTYWIFVGKMKYIHTGTTNELVME